MNYKEFNSSIIAAFDRHSISRAYKESVMRFFLDIESSISELCKELQIDCLPLLCDIQRVLLEAFEER